MTKYNKFIVAAIGCIVTVLSARYGASDWFRSLVALLTAIGVYATPNMD